MLNIPREHVSEKTEAGGVAPSIKHFHMSVRTWVRFLEHMEKPGAGGPSTVGQRVETSRSMELTSWLA